ncbi:MAG: hypothetical protein HFE58_05350 [Firmicutes bacterium]|nr:hypothetical protein [Bacillota bacterium]
MKKLIKKCCYIFVSAFLSTNTMLSIVSAKTIQENNTTYSIPYNIQCIIKDHNNILTQENKDFLEQVFYNTFDDIWYKYGYSSKEPPIVTFLINDKFVSKDFVGSELGNGLIALKESVFQNVDGNTENTIIHELTHIAQEYKNVNSFSWLTEGIAEYITAEYSPHKLLPQYYDGGELYDGYTTTAGFLKWLEKQYPNSIMTLHHSMQKGTIRYESFQELTGKTLTALWREYSGKELPYMESYLLSQYKTSDFVKLGDYYFYGYESKPDFAKALNYYQKAAYHNDFNALTRVADIYATYLNEPDYHKAYTIYKRVIDSKTFYSAYASNTVGRMIQNGLLEGIDTSQSEFYYKQAIAIEEEQGINSNQSYYAMEQLGDFYCSKKDPVAKIWYQKAVERGSDYAKMMLECYIPYYM